MERETTESLLRELTSLLGDDVITNCGHKLSRKGKVNRVLRNALTEFTGRTQRNDYFGSDKHIERAIEVIRAKVCLKYGIDENRLLSDIKETREFKPIRMALFCYLRHNAGIENVSECCRAVGISYPIGVYYEKKMNEYFYELAVNEAMNYYDEILNMEKEGIWDLI
jgi:hypothetical protein